MSCSRTVAPIAFGPLHTYNVSTCRWHQIQSSWETQPATEQLRKYCQSGCSGESKAKPFETSMLLADIRHVNAAAHEAQLKTRNISKLEACQAYDIDDVHILVLPSRGASSIKITCCSFSRLRTQRTSIEEVDPSNTFK